MGAASELRSDIVALCSKRDFGPSLDINRGKGHAALVRIEDESTHTCGKC